MRGWRFEALQEAQGKYIAQALVDQTLQTDGFSLCVAKIDRGKKRD